MYFSRQVLSADRSSKTLTLLRREEKIMSFPYSLSFDSRKLGDILYQKYYALSTMEVLRRLENDFNPKKKDW